MRSKLCYDSYNKEMRLVWIAGKLSSVNLKCRNHPLPDSHLQIDTEHELMSEMKHNIAASLDRLSHAGGCICFVVLRVIGNLSRFYLRDVMMFNITKSLGVHFAPYWLTLTNISSNHTDDANAECSTHSTLSCDPLTGSYVMMMLIIKMRLV